MSEDLKISREDKTQQEFSWIPCSFLPSKTFKIIFLS